MPILSYPFGLVHGTWIKKTKNRQMIFATLQHDTETEKSDDDYHFVDTLAIIQDVAFKLEETLAPKLHWWNRFGIWLSKLRRK